MIRLVSLAVLLALARRARRREGVRGAPAAPAAGAGRRQTLGRELGEELPRLRRVPAQVGRRQAEGGRPRPHHQRADRRDQPRVGPSQGGGRGQGLQARAMIRAVAVSTVAAMLLLAPLASGAQPAILKGLAGKPPEARRAYVIDGVEVRLPPPDGLTE